MKQKFAIAIHGGAGTIDSKLLTSELEKEYKNALNEAVMAGYNLLQKGADSLDAVCAAVVSLENCPLFNAGKGAVLNHLGKYEMDAAVMEGKEKNVGSICGVNRIKNPILLAQEILKHSPHVMLTGNGAIEFAKMHGFELVDDSYFFTEHRYQQWLDIKDTSNYLLDHTSTPSNKMGTVGAVAIDINGNLAAATSTGGMTNKQFGRVGDSPIIGAGTYANNNTCAISCTGHGELFIRSVVAYDISCLMEYKNMSLNEACQLVVKDKLVKIGGEGGLVAIDKIGNIEMPFNSEGMYRACIDVDGNRITEIY